jgi:hypothetical protein
MKKYRKNKKSRKLLLLRMRLEMIHDKDNVVHGHIWSKNVDMDMNQSRFW